MKLYYHPLSTYSQKVLIACYEKGIAFSRHIINLEVAAERKKYNRIYPIGKLPLLITDQNHMIPESSIIIEYFDRTDSKAPRLIPNDADEARQVRFRDRMHDLYLNDPTVTILSENLKPESRRNPALVNKSRKTLDVIYEFLNHELKGHTWSNGEDFTMADCAAAPALFYAQRVHSFNKYPTIRAYFSRLMGRPSYRKVIREAEPLMKKFLS